MLYIRADANERIGTGHVMRCLSITEEFCKQGEQATFIIADDRSRAMIEDRGFSVICLNSIWNNLEMETATLISLIKAKAISTILIDSYFVTETYLREIGQYVKLIYIDDLNQFLYPVNILINYNIYADTLNYEKRYREAGLHTKFMLGCKYVPLRKEFTCNDKKIKERVYRILITSGGTDSYNVVGRLLDRLSEESWFQNIEYHVILGYFNKNKEKLKRRWLHSSNVILFENIMNMADHMKQCDLAITAGGVTTYELCAVGIPSIMYTLADNQLNIARTMSRLNIMPWAGDVRENIQDCLKKIIEYIEIFDKNPGIYQEYVKRMQNLVDGKGCERLVESLGIKE